MSVHCARALGDDADNPSFVQTLRGHGYRFIAPLSGGPAAHAAHSAYAETTPQFVARSMPLPSCVVTSTWRRGETPKSCSFPENRGSGNRADARVPTPHRRGSNVGIAASQCVEGFGGTGGLLPHPGRIDKAV